MKADAATSPAAARVPDHGSAHGAVLAATTAGSSPGALPAPAGAPGASGARVPKLDLQQALRASAAGTSHATPQPSPTHSTQLSSQRGAIADAAVHRALESAVQKLGKMPLPQALADSALQIVAPLELSPPLGVHEAVAALQRASVKLLMQGSADLALDLMRNPVQVQRCMCCHLHFVLQADRLRASPRAVAHDALEAMACDFLECAIACLYTASSCTTLMHASPLHACQCDSR